MLTCRGCSIDFPPKRKGQQYHSRDCFIKSTTKNVLCPECGIEFKRKFTKKICCSPECAFSYRAKKLTKGKFSPCSFDDKPVYKMRSKIRRYNFCDNFCKVAWLRSDKNPFKKRKHTPEEKEKIRTANLNRDYKKIITEKTRQKFRKNARNSILRPEVIEKTRILNRNRMLDSTLSKETKEKIRLNARFGLENKMWKGDFASYAAMHMWVVRHNGKAKQCIDVLFGGLECKGRFEWSNDDHKYKRDLNDYHERCTRHHRMYDILRGLTIPTGKQAHFFVKANNLHVLDFTVDALIIERNDMKFASSY